MMMEEGGGGMAYTLSMSSTAFAGVTTAIGMLTGFRLNASYGRYFDGRKQWSDVNTIVVLSPELAIVSLSALSSSNKFSS
jgi:predicted membrane chloride channel (bestrophin family)